MLTTLDIYGEKVFLRITDENGRQRAGVATLIPAGDSWHNSRVRQQILYKDTGKKDSYGNAIYEKEWYSAFDYSFNGQTYTFYYNDRNVQCLGRSDFGYSTPEATTSQYYYVQGFDYSATGWMQRLPGLTKLDEGERFSYNGEEYKFLYKFAEGGNKYSQIYRGTNGYVIYEGSSSAGTVKFFNSNGDLSNTITL